MNNRRPWTRNEIRILNGCAIIVFGVCSVGLTTTGVMLIWFGAYVKGAANLCVAILFGALTWSAVSRFRGR